MTDHELILKGMEKSINYLKSYYPSDECCEGLDLAIWILEDRIDDYKDLVDNWEE